MKKIEKASKSPVPGESHKMHLILSAMKECDSPCKISSTTKFLESQ